MSNTYQSDFRKTTQHLMPSDAKPTGAGDYDIYPAHEIGDGKIESGYAVLAKKIADYKVVMIDGYVGVFWDQFREALDQKLRSSGITVSWTNIEETLLPEKEIEKLVEPWLGGDDPIFGKRYPGNLIDFFDEKKLKQLQPNEQTDLSIVYGSGASLSNWSGYFVYVDLPKNEIQFRSRAGTVRNLGRRDTQEPKPQYKRFYFVDWVVLNREKEKKVSKIDLIVDGQRPDDPVFAAGEDFRKTLASMSTSAFRVRPWFEPGAWGGHWIKKHIKGLAENVPNYAWSFELIVPENGLIIKSNETLLEFSFDFLMYAHGDQVQGFGFDRFQYEFPIRFDFLDTFDGGNLSVQCHPSNEYARSEFGETFTQDETYYILDCEPGADVYLGFQEGIDPDEFRNALEKSQKDAVEIDVEKYVQKLPANKHDLFLIPNGTIHCSGINNLVLEISATPYIFTFKMYDWMRLDLDGKLRPINIDRAFHNLRFERQGDVVKETLLSKPSAKKISNDYTLVHLPTHPEHFYDIQRHEFRGSISLETNNSPHVLSLVEGKTVEVETPDGSTRVYNYAETFVIPAGTKTWVLKTKDDTPVKVVDAFLKPVS